MVRFHNTSPIYLYPIPNIPEPLRDVPLPLEKSSDNYAGYLPTDEARPAYKGVDGLLLNWEGDPSARRSLLGLQQVLEGDCGCCTQAFEIPVVENPITMLATPLAAFLREPNQDRLLDTPCVLPSKRSRMQCRKRLMKAL